MGRRIKGSGYVPDGGDSATGRTAVPRIDEIGKNRPFPQEREMPSVRHLEFEIFIGEGDDSTDSVGAREAAVGYFKLWKVETEQRHVTVMDLRFEFIAENKMVIYCTYSR